MTSDSLALWFAGEINAEALVLVKSASNKTSDLKQLVVSGYLDEYFPQMLARTNVEKVACVSINDLEILQQALVSGTIPQEIRIDTKGTNLIPSPCYEDINAGFFCQVRRTTSEGGSVHQVHDRLNEEVQRSLMTNRQDSRFARPQAARRVAPRDGCNEKKDKLK